MQRHGRKMSRVLSTTRMHVRSVIAPLAVRNRRVPIAGGDAHVRGRCACHPAYHEQGVHAPHVHFGPADGPGADLPSAATVRARTTAASAIARIQPQGWRTQPGDSR